MLKENYALMLAREAAAEVLGPDWPKLQADYRAGLNDDYADVRIGLAAIRLAWSGMNGEGDDDSIALPTPIEALKFRMEQGDHTQTDLARLLGSRSKAAEILNGKRSISRRQIAIISDVWGVPARCLLGYPLTLPDTDTRER